MILRVFHVRVCRRSLISDCTAANTALGTASDPHRIHRALQIRIRGFPRGDRTVTTGDTELIVTESSKVNVDRAHRLVNTGYNFYGNDLFGYCCSASGLFF